MNRTRRSVKGEPREHTLGDLEPLLDHLGRLLAEEYISLLTTPPTDESDPQESQ